MQKYFFLGEMIPPYEEKDIIRILKYYAQYETPPQFYSFDDIDRSRLDVSAIAKHIWDEDMGQRQKTEYVNSLWESSDDNLLKLFFGRKLYFWRQLDIELTKLSNPHIYDDEENVQCGRRNLEELSLYEIGKVNPELEKSFGMLHLNSQKILTGTILVPVVEKKEQTGFSFR